MSVQAAGAHRPQLLCGTGIRELGYFLQHPESDFFLPPGPRRLSEDWNLGFTGGTWNLVISGVVSSSVSLCALLVVTSGLVCRPQHCKTLQKRVVKGWNEVKQVAPPPRPPLWHLPPPFLTDGEID